MFHRKNDKIYVMPENTDDLVLVTSPVPTANRPGASSGPSFLPHKYQPEANTVKALWDCFTIVSQPCFTNLNVFHNGFCKMYH